jgi:hypothetical protein
MTTFTLLIDDVRQHFQNYLEDEEEFVTLNAPIDADDLLITVDSALHLDRGVIEIGDELILLKSIDKTANTAEVRLRGHLSTTAVSHSVGDLVRVQPLVPRTQIKRAINDSIEGAYPTMYQVKRAPLIPYVGGVQMYELPDDVGDILSVKYNAAGATAWWQPATVWELDEHGNTEVLGNAAVFPSGKALWIGDTPVAGEAIQVVYTAKPGELSAEADTLESTVGLPGSCRDLVAFGAMARLLPAVEAGRLQHTSIEQSVRAQLVHPQDAVSASKYYLQLYTIRVQEEGVKLQALHRVQIRTTF